MWPENTRSALRYMYGARVREDVHDVPRAANVDVVRVFGTLLAYIKVAHAGGVDYVRGPKRIAYFGERGGIGHAHRSHVDVGGNPRLRGADAEQAIRGHEGLQLLENRPAVDGRDAGDEDAYVFAPDDGGQPRNNSHLIGKSLTPESLRCLPFAFHSPTLLYVKALFRVAGFCGVRYRDARFGRVRLGGPGLDGARRAVRLCKGKNSGAMLGPCDCAVYWCAPFLSGAAPPSSVENLSCPMLQNSLEVLGTLKVIGSRFVLSEARIS